MGVIDGTLVEIETITYNANICKELMLEQLVKDEKITPEDFNTYSEKWNIICIKLKWFERWRNKFKPGLNSKDYIYKLVRFEK